jgi:hypothetical protein
MLNNIMPFVGAAASAFGQYRANKQTASYATRMSNTAHQRQMADMKAAGLNPILSAKYGGASTPNVQFGNVGSAASSAYQQMSQARASQEQAALSKEQAAKVKYEVNKVLPKMLQKLNSEYLLNYAKIPVHEAETALKKLSIAFQEMDKQALEYLGLSPMQLKHTPINQIGSMAVDGAMKLHDKGADAVAEFIDYLISTYGE